MQENMKHSMCIIGIPEGEEEEQGIEKLFEKVIMKIFPNFMGEKVTQIHKSQRVPIKRNPKGPTSKHIIIKIAEFQDKERNLKVASEKQEATYKGAPIRVGANLSMEMLQARRGWK